MLIFISHKFLKTKLITILCAFLFYRNMNFLFSFLFMNMMALTPALSAIKKESNLKRYFSKSNFVSIKIIRVFSFTFVFKTTSLILFSYLNLQEHFNSESYISLINPTGLFKNIIFAKYFV